MHPDWTLRVPVVRPRAAAWLDGAVIVAVMAAILFALHSLADVAAPALAASAVAAAVAAFLYVRSARHSKNAVSAVRMDRDGAFHLRMRSGWRPAEWIALWRGPRWLTLQARLPAEPAGFCNGRPHAGRPRRQLVLFTIWQDRLPAPAWRRACLLVNRRLCRTPAARAARAS